MEIHKKIENIVKKNKESTYSLAPEFGVSQQTISNYLNGSSAMPIKFLSWYLHKHPEIDLYDLFDMQQRNFVSEPKPEYHKYEKKKIMIEKITAIIEENF